MVFGKAITSVEPFTLAMLRWVIASAILLCLCRPSWPVLLQTFRENYKLLFLCGFLGYWTCGGIVYLALRYTSATNGILIYTTTPLIILGIEAWWRNRGISFREILGITIAVSGVLAIILQGDFSTLLTIQFNPGDIIFVLVAISWAVYSVLLKSPSLSHLRTLPLLALVASCGAVLVIPFAIGEIALFQKFPVTRFEWLNIGGIVVFSSILSFLSYQYGVRMLGASIAGIFMYLMPAFGLYLSWVFLGERLEAFHISGTIFILGGVVTATLPIRLSKRSAP